MKRSHPDPPSNLVEDTTDYESSSSGDTRYPQSDSGSSSSSSSSDERDEDGDIRMVPVDAPTSAADDESLERPQSLSLTVFMTDRGTVLIEAKGDVPLQATRHLTINSRLEQNLPVTFVTSILLHVNPICLKSLSFSQAALSGTRHDFEDFTSAILSIDSLQELHLIDCCLLNDAVDSTPLDILLYGICSEGVLPKLHLVELYAVDIDREPVGSFLSPGALSYLIENKTSLTTLNMEDLCLTDEHMFGVATALERNKVLKFLKLWGCGVQDRGMIAIAGGLEKNTILEQLDLSYNELQDTGAIALAQCMYINKTIKIIRMVCNDQIVYGSKGYKALLEALKYNHHIEDLLINPSAEDDSDLAFYLWCNAHRFLLEDSNTTREKLVETLYNHRGDTTFLYHFLKAVPAMMIADMNVEMVKR